MIAASNDIEQLTKQLEESQRRIAIIKDINLELNAISSLPDKLDKILKILHYKFGINHSMMVLPDKDKRLVVKASYGYGKHYDDTIDVGHGIIGLSALHKKPINITGIRRKKKFMLKVSEGVAGHNTFTPGLEDPESQIAIPLVSNDELVAVMMAESYNTSVFSKDDENFLITISQSIAVSIQNAMLFDNMEELIAQRTAALEKSNQARDRLFSIISHDLRGPVTSFHNISKLIHHYTKQGEKEKIDTLFGRIDKSVGRLNDLLDNLLHWSMSHRNEIRCHIQKINIVQLLNEVSAIYEEQLLSKNIKISFAEAGETLISGDYNTLSAVFRNILSNALKYTPHNGSISFSIDREDEFVTVNCTDTGVGIEPEKLARLFEFTGEGSTQGTNNEKGTGLGLLIARQFVQLNNGQLHIESIPGCGTTVTVKLPHWNIS